MDQYTGCWVWITWVTPELLDLGLTISVSHGHHGPAMAESTMGMIVSLARSLHRAAEWTAAGEWWRPRIDHSIIDLLGAKKMTILGYGAIGREVAQRAKAFGMTVEGLTRSDKGTDNLGVRILGPDAIDESLKSADVVVNILPHTTATHQLVNKGRIESLKIVVSSLILVAVKPLMKSP